MERGHSGNLELLSGLFGLFEFHYFKKRKITEKKISPLKNA